MLENRKPFQWEICVSCFLAVIALVAWGVGLYNESRNEIIAGRANAVFLFCWSLVAFIMTTKRVLTGVISGRSRGGQAYSISRNEKPIQFWATILFFLAAGLIALLLGAKELFKHQ